MGRLGIGRYCFVLICAVLGIPASFAGPADDWAIIIGIDHYLRGFDPLKVADQDAKSFSIHLGTPRAGRIPPSHIIPLIDQNNTPVEARKAFDQLEDVLTRKAGPRSRVYIFLSLQGMTPPNIDEGYLATSNTYPEKAGLGSNAIAVSELKKLIANSPAREIVIFADVCRQRKNTNYDNLINYKMVSLGKLHKSVIGLLASDGKQGSVEAQHNGLFSASLLEGLQGSPKVPDGADGVGGPKDTLVSFDELWRWVLQDVPERSRALNIASNQKASAFGDMALRVLALSDMKAPMDRSVIATRRIRRLGTIASLDAVLSDSEEPPVDEYEQQPDQATTAFEQALSRRQLLGPGSASELFERIQKNAAPGEDEQKRIAGLRSRLAAALESEGQEVISSYGTGDRFPGDPKWRQAQLPVIKIVRAAQLLRAAEQYAPERKDSFEARALFCDGRALMIQLEATKAVAAFRSASDLDKNFAEPVNAAGVIALGAGALDEAAASFRRAKKIAPVWAYPRHNLALIYIERGEYSRAEAEYREALTLTPWYPYLRYNLAVLLQRLNRTAEAQVEYAQAIDLFKDAAADYGGRADRAHTAGNKEQEVAARTQADLLERNAAEALTGSATLMEAEHPAAAKALYEQALKRYPDLIPARHNLGLLLLAQWRANHQAATLDEAITQFQRNVDTLPEFQPSMLALAQSLLAKGEPARAEAYFRRLPPRLLEVRLGLADSLTAQRREKEAAVELRDAIDTERKASKGYASPSLYLALGDILRQAGDSTGACSQFQAAYSASKQAVSDEWKQRARDRLRQCRP